LISANNQNERQQQVSPLISIFHQDTRIDSSSEVLNFDTTGMANVAPLTLRRFPAEIRHMIFRATLEGSWKGKAPEFIISLRGDKELYKEALNIFYETNTFALTKRNRWLSMSNAATGRSAPLHQSSLEALKTIRRIAINLPSLMHG
jgi:hypothetical protein